MKTKKLQDEVDITKADTRLAIIEQQQEVKSCECQLRGLSTSMEKFLAKLKCIDTGWYSQKCVFSLTLLTIFF